MTAPVDIAALRARVAQATPLPWAHDASGVFHVESLGPVLDEDRTRKGNAVGIGRVGDTYPRGDNHPTENMALIAAAVNGLPALLDELEGLRQIHTLATRVEQLVHDHGWSTDSDGVTLGTQHKRETSETLSALFAALDRARAEGR